jgi:hypothetical protein
MEIKCSPKAHVSPACILEGGRTFKKWDIVRSLLILKGSTISLEEDIASLPLFLPHCKINDIIVSLLYYNYYIY